jgi:tRNA-specific 2-thiouridylase
MTVANSIGVAMSGGVDSCVAAAMLKEQGYDVVGITMQLWDHAKGSGEERFDSCCSLTDVHDARLAAHNLGIPHYVVNYEREFKAGVVDYFASEYGQGRTPNPCVMCNSKLKFDHLIERALALGAENVATGHYARLIHKDDGSAPELRTGLDPNKDQSYFLFDVRRDYLERALFPLGGMTKPEVREIAKKYGIHTASKHESQEICFVTGGRYSEFLEKHYPEMTRGLDGEIVDTAGKVLGRHDGIHLFTVGQRKGLGAINSLTPKYVKSIDGKTRRVVVDDLENLAVAGFTVGEVNWLVPVDEVTEARELSVMVRYRARPVACRVRRQAGTARGYEVLLAERARWVTPGQAAVFYEGDRVLGGGFIASADLNDHDGEQTKILRAAQGAAPQGVPAH